MSLQPFISKWTGNTPLILGVLLVAVTLGCHRWATSGPKVDYKTVVDSPTRDTDTAERRHQEAIRQLDRGNPALAEQLVQKALIADVSYGPAHNTLGKIYFDCQKYYLAAWEFEYAAESMPERAEPHNNLGLVYEAVERLDEAVFQFQLAHEIEPDNPEYLGNFLRGRIRRGESPSDMQQEFERLLFIETRDSWRYWCQKNLAFTDEQGSKPDDSNTRASEQAPQTEPFELPPPETIPEPNHQDPNSARPAAQK